MRGEVIFYDGERGMGFITGEDGSRYAFARKDLGNGEPAKGSRVTFEAEGATARSILLPSRPAPRTAPAAAGGATPEPGFRVPEISARGAASVSDPADLDGDPGMFGYFRRALTTDYANFRTRARRKEYWSFALFTMIALLLIVAVSAAVDASLGNLDSETPIVLGLASVLAALALIVPTIAVTVRRIHDIGLSGWFFLVGFIPTIGNLILLVFALIPSQKHDNRWGPVPPGAG